jgi:phosphohistidine phosphatase
MKHLTLVRHAQAEPAGVGEQDVDRLLTRRGMQEATLMARRLQQTAQVPDRIISSTARRAHSTASLLANTLQLSEASLVADARIYAAGPMELLTVLRGAPLCERLLLVGHNPTISELADRLSAKTRIPTLPTCGLVSLQFEIQDWSQLNWSTGIDVSIDSPDRSDH